MKTLGAVVLVLIALTVVVQVVIQGMWPDRHHGLPAVTLVIQEAQGKVTGTIVFDFQTRESLDVDGPWRVEGGAPESTIAPLPGPRIEGRLSFEVRRARTHGSAAYGPNQAMAVDLVRPDEARSGAVALIREP